MTRFAVAATIVLVLGAAFGFSSCGGSGNRPDAGAGGGASLVGGGSSGSTGGGRAGGSAGTGGGTTMMMSRDGGECLQLGPLTWNGVMGMPGGEYFVIPPDGGMPLLAGINYTGTVAQVMNTTGQSAFITVEALLINRMPTTPVTFPFTGSFQTLPAMPMVEPRSFFGLGCASTGANCAADFIAVSGDYNVTAGTPNTMTGNFAGSFTSTRYRQILVGPTGQFGLVPDGGCIDVAGFNFNVNW